MADPTDKPGYAFGSAPPRAVRDFLAGKTPVATRGFRDLEPQEHAVAFTVAQSAKFDILSDVQAALQKALDEGQTFETFRKGLAPTLAAQGWWGRKVVDGREVQLGSPRRLRTIYRANMRAARAAGQWERIERVRDALPYLLYQLGPSERDRPHHAAKDGWVLPVDDPFWNEWMPPNGWGCKCHVRQITAQEAGRRGIIEQVNIPRRTVRDPVTLKPRDLPAGLDPAWSSNPGKDRLRNAEAFLEGRLAALARRPGPDASPRARALADELGPAMTRAAARDVAQSWRVSRIHDGGAPGSAPVGLVSEAAARALGATTRVVKYGGAGGADDVPAKMRRKRPEVTTAPLAHLAQAFDQKVGERVFPVGGSLVAFFATEGALWKFVIKRPHDARGELWVSSWHRAGEKAIRAERRKWLERESGKGGASPGS